MHSTGCEKHPFGLDYFVLTGIAETKTFSVPVKEINLSTMGLFIYELAKKKEISPAWAKARAQRSASATSEYSISGRRVFFDAGTGT